MNLCKAAVKNQGAAADSEEKDLSQEVLIPGQEAKKPRSRETPDKTQQKSNKSKAVHKTKNILFNDLLRDISPCMFLM